jgi:hypothetical protein
MKDMLDFHTARGAEATILVTKVDDPSKYGEGPATPVAFATAAQLNVCARWGDSWSQPQRTGFLSAGSSE